MLNATRDYALKLPAANGKIATVGFCWGGSASFNYATAQPALNAAAVFYGSSPDAAKLATIKAPVMGFYGGNDARVNATIEPAVAEMKKLGKPYTPHIYEGAGHGFLRQQNGAGRRQHEGVRAGVAGAPRVLPRQPEVASFPRYRVMPKAASGRPSCVRQASTTIDVVDIRQAS